MSRRSVAKLAFFGSLGVIGVAGGATIANTLYPRVADALGEVIVPRDQVPPRGRSIYVPAGNFVLAHLGPDEGHGEPVAGRSPVARTPTPGGLLAMYEKCPHLGCAVSATDSYRFGRIERTDLIVCNCHQGVFTSAGVRVFGPPPRSLDTMELRVTPYGDVVVQTRNIRLGDSDNPARAVPWPRPS